MKAEFVRNAQTQFLRDTVTHYNSSNRSRDAHGRCLYSPTETSDGCAIGRHIPNKITCKFMDLSGKSITTPSFDEYLPATLLVIPLGFSKDVQMLHDCTGNWSDGGLSTQGLQEVKLICETFRLDVSEVLKGTGYES